MCHLAIRPIAATNNYANHAIHPRQAHLLQTHGSTRYRELNTRKRDVSHQTGTGFRAHTIDMAVPAHRVMTSGCPHGNGPAPELKWYNTMLKNPIQWPKRRCPSWKDSRAHAGPRGVAPELGRLPKPSGSSFHYLPLCSGLAWDQLVP